jgi:hypothetical protein
MERKMNRGKRIASILVAIFLMLGTSYVSAQPGSYAGNTGNAPTGSPEEIIRRGQPERKSGAMEPIRNPGNESKAQQKTVRTISGYEERVEKITVKSDNMKGGKNNKPENQKQQQPPSSQGGQPLPTGRGQNQNTQQPLEQINKR